PEAVDPQPLQVVELLDEALQVAGAVVGAVEEATDEDFVEDGPLVPARVVRVERHDPPTRSAMAARTVLARSLESTSSSGAGRLHVQLGQASIVPGMLGRSDWRARSSRVVVTSWAGEEASSSWKATTR